MYYYTVYCSSVPLLYHHPDLMTLGRDLHGEKCPHSDWFDFVWGSGLLPLLLQGGLRGIIKN